MQYPSKSYEANFIFFTAILCWPARLTTAQTAAPASFRALQVDAGKVTGAIRSFQGLNGPPYPIMEGLPDLIHQYQDLHIDSIRTHDIMGPTDIAAHYSVANPLLAWLVPDLQQRTRLVNAGNDECDIS